MTTDLRSRKNFTFALRRMCKPADPKHLLYSYSVFKEQIGKTVLSEIRGTVNRVFRKKSLFLGASHFVAKLPILRAPSGIFFRKSRGKRRKELTRFRPFQEPLMEELHRRTSPAPQLDFESPGEVLPYLKRAASKPPKNSALCSKRQKKCLLKSGCILIEDDANLFLGCTKNLLWRTTSHRETQVPAPSLAKTSPSPGIESHIRDFVQKQVVNKHAHEKVLVALWRQSLQPKRPKRPLSPGYQSS